MERKYIIANKRIEKRLEKLKRERIIESRKTSKLTWKAAARRARIRNLSFVREYKEKTGCQACGNKFPHYILDFDHLGKKTGNISVMAGHRYKLERIIKEIKKCEVVCGNCHKRRTWERQHPDSTK